jgi:hypothetical protein
LKCIPEKANICYERTFKDEIPEKNPICMLVKIGVKYDADEGSDRNVEYITGKWREYPGF